MSTTRDAWFFLEPDTHDGSDLVQIEVRIRRNSDGVIRTYEGKGYWDDGLCGEPAGPSTFIWEEGNFSCDCNRELFFLRAGQEPEHDEVECGADRYAVELVNPKDGRVFYSDFEATR